MFALPDVLFIHHDHLTLDRLSQSIFLLRKALGETAQDHRYIVTIPSRGYRFAERVEEISEETADLIVERHSRAQITVQESECAPYEGSGASLLRILSPTAVELDVAEASEVDRHEVVCGSVNCQN